VSSDYLTGSCFVSLGVTWSSFLFARSPTFTTGLFYCWELDRPVTFCPAAKQQPEWTPIPSLHNLVTISLNLCSGSSACHSVLLGQRLSFPTASRESHFLQISPSLAIELHSNPLQLRLESDCRLLACCLGH
jgi:hypothetical protein